MAELVRNAAFLDEFRESLAPWLHLFLAWNGDSCLRRMTNGRMESLGNVGLLRENARLYASLESHPAGMAE